ncbi:class I SAM-dependent methyltransferase [Glaciecola sp. SC05]|uniref:class I SAM-dependent methyltransferase n=1 Tax=Glaciecola sp. SC05 TaxID=1987355 RepID=UPI00352933DE
MIKSLMLGAASALLMLTATVAQANHHEKGEMAGKMLTPMAALEKAVNDTTFRTEREMERDQFRNPVQTLNFFGLEPTMTVAELGPSSGWYTKIIAPLTAHHGKYIALNGSPNPESERYESQMQWRETFINHESGMFGHNASARYIRQAVPFAAPNSVDMVLIFRGMHGQIGRGDVNGLLAEILSSLKPGGVLGIVQHREREDFDTDPKTTMRGYVKQSYIIDLVTGAGFELEASSEINANAKDPADWERGVWALQAGRPIAEKDPQFQEIGESDRMTLKFVKPAK